MLFSWRMNRNSPFRRHRTAILCELFLLGQVDCFTNFQQVGCIKPNVNFGFAKSNQSPWYLTALAIQSGSLINA